MKGVLASKDCFRYFNSVNKIAFYYYLNMSLPHAILLQHCILPTPHILAAANESTKDTLFLIELYVLLYCST